MRWQWINFQDKYMTLKLSYYTIVVLVVKHWSSSNNLQSQHDLILKLRWLTPLYSIWTMDLDRLPFRWPGYGVVINKHTKPKTMSVISRKSNSRLITVTSVEGFNRVWRYEVWFYVCILLVQRTDTGLKLVSTIFNGTGFKGWKRSITIALPGKNKLGFVNGTVKRAVRNQEYAKVWDRVNDVIIG